MSLKKDLAKGTFYLAIAKYSGILVSLVVTAVLSRILTPEDYGIVAVASVFIVFFNILSDVGIGPAVIQNKQLDNEDLNNIFSYTVYSGITLGLIFFLSSGFIADYYKDNQLETICRILSLSIFFSCINIVPTNLLYKAKNFKYVSYSTFWIQLILGVISIASACYGIGIYALLISPILSPFCLFLLYNHHVKLRFRINCKLESMKKIFSFSLYQFLFNMVNYFSRNADKLLLGKYVGLAPLGQYEKSYRLMLLPLQNITFVVTPVMHPIFSEYQDNLQEMAKKYCKVVTFLGFIGFPLSALLFFIAKPLILLIFGNQWLPAVEPFKILSFSVGIQIITSTTGSIFQASNSTKQLFLTSVVVAICMVGSFIIAACYYHAIIAMAYAFLISKSLDMIISYYSLMKTIKYQFIIFIKSIIKPIFVGCIVFLILLILNTYIDDYISFKKNIFSDLIVNTSVWLVVTSIFFELFGEFKPLSGVVSLIKKRL